MNVPAKITNALINSGTISHEDKDLYLYGLTQGMVMLLNIATTATIGLAFGMVWQSLIFLFAYIPLRTYAGGYHARTQLKCYLFSIVIIIAVLLVIKLAPWTGFICGIVTLVAGVVIVTLAPVEDRNKPLDQVEKVIYRKRMCFVLGVLVGIELVCWFIGGSFVSVDIAMSVGVAAVMVVLGKLVNLWREVYYDNQEDY